MIVEKVDQGCFRFRLDREELRLGSSDFFHDIKEFVPGQCRRYDENARVWTVDEKFLPLVLQKLKYHFPTNPPTDVVLSEIGALSRYFVKQKHTPNPSQEGNRKRKSHPFARKAVA